MEQEIEKLLIGVKQVLSEDLTNKRKLDEAMDSSNYGELTWQHANIDNLILAGHISALEGVESRLEKILGMPKESPTQPKTPKWANGDFKPYYCTTAKKHVWVIGYFGGGAINFARFKEAAQDFANYNGVDISTVSIDEIFNSRRFKRFKFITSSQEEQKPIEGFSEVTNDVFKWLTD